MDPSTLRRRVRRAVAVTTTGLLGAALVVPVLATPPALSSGPPAAVSAARTWPVAVAADSSADMVAAEPVRSRRRLDIAADAPETAAVGSTFEVVGTASTLTRRGRSPRRVTLAERRGGTWNGLQSVRTSAYGEFAFTVAAGSAVTPRVFRVVAPAHRGLRPARTAALVVEVVAAEVPATPTDLPGPDVPPDPDPGFDPPEPLPVDYVGAGSPSAWSYLFTGGGRWNPCQVIRWAYNPAGEGYPALADVQRAMAMISGVSGLRFSYTGPTAWRYLGSLTDPAFPADRADIVVGWANDRELPVLEGNVVGYGGGSGTGVDGQDVRVRVTRGFLTLDNGQVLPGGFDQPGWGQVTLHEILHALGLGHASESVQVMYGTMHRGNTRFGAGDLTGMQAIGSAGGCLS